MPVLGHAVAGLIIGMSTKPAAPRDSPSRVQAGSALWLPAAVALSYLPDVVAQLGLSGGWRDGRLLGHSVVFAVAASLIAGAALARLAGVSLARAVATALSAILLHDLLDLAQATDRAPWWPWSDRRVGSDLGLLPTDSVREAVVFGLLLLAFLGLHRAFRGAVGRAETGPRVRSAGSPAIRLGHAFIAVVVLAAALTHSLRDARERDLAAARTLVEQQSYAAGLAALARAERWPSTAKPGRIDYLRGEAYAGLGDRQRAEACYLRAYAADPAYFWAVADLAVFYASSSQPVTERRRLIAPYLNRLQTDFATHAALPQVLARVERRLATAGPDDATRSTPGQPGQDRVQAIPDSGSR